MKLHSRIAFAGLVTLGFVPAVACWSSSSVGAFQDAPKAATKPRTPNEPQPRKSGEKVKVDPSKISVDDGDTVTIKWGDNDEEIVRILGIDTPETIHVSHNIPVDQPYGREARAFAQGAFSTASEVELLRCTTLDPYKLTLGYLFINGKNYSLLVIKSRLAEESVTPFGDNGFPEIAAEVKAAAKAAGPLPFESPNLFRRRMRPLSDWMKTQPQEK
jgi:micrococcal nuclease